MVLDQWSLRRFIAARSVSSYPNKVRKGEAGSHKESIKAHGGRSRFFDKRFTPAAKLFSAI